MYKTVSQPVFCPICREKNKNWKKRVKIKKKIIFSNEQSSEERRNISLRTLLHSVVMEEQMHRHTSKGREVYSIIRVFNSGQFSSMYKYLRLIPESWFIFIFILFIITRIIINVIISTTSQLAFARARSRPHYKAV